MTDPNAAAKKLGLTLNNGEAEFSGGSVVASMGGRMGIAESVLPGFLFLLVWSFTKDSLASIVSASAIALVFVTVRLATKKVVTQALVGVVGVAITAFMVLRDGGTAADYFVPGFFTNAAYATVLAVSILVRWPLIGLLVGALSGKATVWRKHPSLVKLFNLATAVWVAMFFARLAIQLPLYFANQIEALGIARLVMGLPLYSMTIWLTWLMVRRVIQNKNNW